MSGVFMEVFDKKGEKTLTQLKGLKTSPWRVGRDEHAKKPNKPISKNHSPASLAVHTGLLCVSLYEFVRFRLGGKHISGI